MKTVKLEDFREPIIHENVDEIVFRGEMDGTNFCIGFLPEREFIYHFEGSPDVWFNNFLITRVYYEPYRTFLKLKSPVDVIVHWKGDSDKLYVRAQRRKHI